MSGESFLVDRDEAVLAIVDRFSFYLSHVSKAMRHFHCIFVLLNKGGVRSFESQNQNIERWFDYNELIGKFRSKMQIR